MRLRIVDIDECNRKQFYKDCDGKDSLITVKAAFDMLEALPTAKVIEDIKAEIKAIEINGQVDEHTMFIRTGEQVKNMALEIIDKHTKAESEG